MNTPNFDTLTAERAFTALRNAAYELRQLGNRKKSKEADELADYVLDEYGIPDDD